MVFTGRLRLGLSNLPALIEKTVGELLETFEPDLLVLEMALIDKLWA